MYEFLLIMVSQIPFLASLALSYKERQKLTAALLVSARNSNVARTYADPVGNSVTEGPIA